MNIEGWQLIVLELDITSLWGIARNKLILIKTYCGIPALWYIGHLVVTGSQGLFD